MPPVSFSDPALDDRSRRLLKTLIEHYIADGQPVGSRTLARASGLELSAATIRNVMADLEHLGLIASPHTSAGRIPTTQGYRLFVDTMLTTQRGSLQAEPLPTAGQVGSRRIITSAAQRLSELSHFVGVVVAPRSSNVFHHVEFLRLSERRILCIMVSPLGDVQNRILLTDTDYSESELTQASNYLNTHFSGLAMEQVHQRLDGEIEHLRREIAVLMQAAVRADGAQDSSGELVISGERNLLEVGDFANNMDQLRRAFELFEQKAQLLRLLDIAAQAEGVRIFIGGESDGVAVEDLSVVSAPYEVDGQVVGTVGVIGPTRMPYNRMVHIVDITSRLVGNALSQGSSATSS